MPYFRRKMFEMFYFLHIQFFFMGNLAVMFHSRTLVLPWLAPALFLFYLDFPIRIIAKLMTVTPSTLDLIGDSMVKLVLKVDSFPLGAFDNHPGSYLWLSCNLRTPSTVATPLEKGTELTPVDDESVTANDKTVGSTYTEVPTAEKAASNTEEGIFAPVHVPGGPAARPCCCCCCKRGELQTHRHQD